MRTPRVLIVAGSDSGGGAGIQADIKTVTMLGGHAMTAITAITAQNTLGVQDVLAIPAEMVTAQIRACLDDIGADAMKIGMIGSAETAHAIADVIEGAGMPVVFDPVMVATSGSILADAATIAAFGRLMRIATLVTPNLPELEALGGIEAVKAAGAAVLVKGGHAGGDVIVDQLFEGDGATCRWEGTRIATTSTHGTGCTLASGIAEGLARGMTLREAIGRARLFVRMALHEAPGLGGGHGPMGHQRVRLDCDLGAAMPNQITLPCHDVQASFAFYAALGLTPIVASGDRYARFESVGGMTVSIEAAEEVAGQPFLFLEVRDLDDAVSRLRGNGIAVDDVAARPWGWREARSRDPAGNVICLYQAGENRRYPAWRLA